MQLVSVQIHNFRSLDDVTLTLGNYGLLVGENNGGKTNVIDALRVFYEKGLSYERLRDFPKFETTDHESWIDIEYLLTDEEYADLKDEYQRPDNRLKVRKYLQTEAKGSDGKKLTGIHGYTKDDSIADEHFYGAKNVQQGKFGHVIHIEELGQLADHTKMTGPSALRDMVNDIVKNLVGSSGSFQELTGEFVQFAETFKTEETGDGQSLAGLETDINAEIDEWDARFRLDINPPSETEIVRNLVSHVVEDRMLGEEVDPARFGQGFQRHLIYTLVRIAARYKSPPQPKPRKDFTPQMTLILFEEPEAFLHPMQQKVLCRSLRTLAERKGGQLLAASHSPYFVSQNVEDIPAIARLHRKDGRTVVGQLNDDALSEVFAENQEIHDILKGTKYEACPEDLTDDMEAVKLFLWLDSERCGLFFARHAFLVEGPTEKALLGYLFAKGIVEAPRGGVFVLDCLGKFNIHRFMNLLAPLNVSHSVLFDADGGAAPHAAIKELIEDSANDCTHKIDTFPEDVEAFLGIEKAGSPHRKPQHMMLRLRDGRVAEDKVAELAKKVRDLLPEGPPG